MTSTDALGQYSLAGFYQSPVSKAILGTNLMGFGLLQMPAAYGLHKYLVCKLPDSFLRGEFWRLLTSKLLFLDTRDLIFSVILIYHFRVFERRLGSRRFSSRLLSSLLLSTALELAISWALSSWFQGENGESSDFSGILSVGPFWLVFPWFASFYSSIPALSSVSNPLFGSLGGGGRGNNNNNNSFLSFSSKSLIYFAGLNVAVTSNANLVSAAAGIMSGILIKQNAFWIQSIITIPSWMSSICHKLIGQLIESGPPSGGPMGATLEIQRSQQMEAIEQQLLRQQQQRFGGLGNHHARQRQNQGFAERLVDDDAGGGGGGFGGGLLNALNRQQRGPQNNAFQPPQPPSEESITMLTDMGFARERVERALARTGNDVQAATMMLLQENNG